MTDLNQQKPGESGVSESIGFLLIFGMVIVGIGLVTLYGYPMLLQQQTSADKQIMEKNMIVLQNDMKSLSFKTVPFKETMLNIGGGSLTVHNSTGTSTFVSVFPSSGGTGPADSYEYVNLGNLQYYSVSANSEITLENGAVVMRNLVEPGSTMLAQPRWFYDQRTNTMVINLILVNSSFPISRAGIGTVQMAMGMTNYSVISPVVGTACVAYTPDPAHDYSKAWENYFTTGMQLSQGSCGSQQFELPVSNGGTLVIKKYDIEIKSV